MLWSVRWNKVLRDAWQHKAKSLSHRDRGKNHQVAQTIVCCQLLIGNTPTKDHPVCNAQVADQLPVHRHQVSATNQHQLCRAFGKPCKAAQQHIHALEIMGAIQTSDEQNNGRPYGQTIPLSETAHINLGMKTSAVHPIRHLHHLVAQPIHQRSNP